MAPGLNCHSTRKKASAFVSAAGKEWLYSGVTKTKASARDTIALQRIVCALVYRRIRDGAFVQQWKVDARDIDELDVERSMCRSAARIHLATSTSWWGLRAGRHGRAGMSPRSQAMTSFPSAPSIGEALR